LIAQLEQVQELQPVQVLESGPVQEPQLEQALVLQLAQVLESGPVQAQESGPVQESQLALVQAQHPLHQPPQSLFQPQRSHLLQHEFLSTFLQLAKVLQYQLCL
jgi:hypothetical protein